MARKYNVEKLQPQGLEGLTDLFGDGGEKTIEEKIVENSTGVLQIPVENIIDYASHKFNKIKEWDEFVESIRLYGVLQPVVLRPHPVRDGDYELIAGHNRKNAAKEIGLETIPAVVVEYDDIDTSVIVGVTNKQREETTDVEWGRTYRVTYELMKNQGKRTDLTFGHDDQKSQSNDEITSGHSDQKLYKKTSLEVLAGKYGESPKTIQRKIRLSYLEDELVDMYLDKKFNQKIAIELSYLAPIEQDHVASVAFAEKIGITEDMAKELRSLSEEKASMEVSMDINDVYSLMKKEEPKTAKEKKSGAKFTVPDSYFPADIKKKDKAQYVLKALQYIQDNGVELE